jgi:hypothetical protein
MNLEIQPFFHLRQLQAANATGAHRLCFFFGSRLYPSRPRLSVPRTTLLSFALRQLPDLHLIPIMSSYPLPPASPTCYLTPEQRTQLMRSTRKLTKVLGATPMLRVAPARHQHSGDDIAAVQYALIDDRHATPVLVTAPATPLPSPTGHWTSADAQARDEIIRHAPRLQFLTEEPCRDTGLRALSSPNTLLHPMARSEALVTPSSTTARRASFFPITPVSASGETDWARMERERRLQRKRLSKLARTFGQVSLQSTANGTLADRRSRPSRLCLSHQCNVRRPASEAYASVARSTSH